MGIFTGLGDKLKAPLQEIIAHFIATIATILTIYGVEKILVLLQLSDHHIPYVQVPFSEWMFALDVLAATVINLVGIYRALRELS